jgi:hypothetical protein
LSGVHEVAAGAVVVRWPERGRSSQGPDDSGSAQRDKQIHHNTKASPKE